MNNKTQEAHAAQMFPRLKTERGANGSRWFWLAAGLVLVGVQVLTAVRLIEARHEIRQLRGEFAQVAEDVTAHDEMLETVGDDVTTLEQQLSALATKTRRKGGRR